MKKYFIEYTAGGGRGAAGLCSSIEDSNHEKLISSSSKPPRPPIPLAQVPQKKSGQCFAQNVTTPQKKMWACEI